MKAALCAHGECAGTVAGAFFMQLKDTLLHLSKLMQKPGTKLLSTYKAITLNGLCSAQGFWKCTTDPETDLYPCHTDDTVRIDIMRQVVALKTVNDVDLRLAHRLSMNWDTPEAMATFVSDTTYDTLRRDATSIFLKLLESTTQTGGAKCNNVEALNQIISLIHRLNHWKKDSAGCKNRVGDRFKSALAQLSSLAGFPIHLGLAELTKIVAKPTALLPANLETLVTHRDHDKLKAAIKATKFCEIADGVKEAVKSRELYTAIFAELKKIGAVLPASDNKRLEELSDSIEASGTCVSTCYTINLICNKLSPPPPTKSRAAFIREYETIMKELKFDASETATKWLEEFLFEVVQREKRLKTVAKPKMSPKRKSAGTSELY